MATMVRRSLALEDGSGNSYHVHAMTTWSVMPLLVNGTMV